MPVWEEDGFKMCQSSAIIRMLGIRLGYYHDDPMTCWQIDSIVDFMEDMMVPHMKPFMPMLGGGAFDESCVDSDWMPNFWGKMISVLSKRLQGHGKQFLAGTDRPTIADFKAYQTIDKSLDANVARPYQGATADKVKSAIAADASFARWVAAMQKEMLSCPCQPRPF